MKWIKENFLLVLMIVFVLLFVVYAVIMLLPNTIDQKTWGVWGDAFGMFNGLAFLIAMYALYLQKKESRKAEEARSQQDLANITFEFTRAVQSKEKLDADGIIFRYYLAHFSNFINECDKLSSIIYKNAGATFSIKDKKYHYSDLLDSIRISYRIYYNLYVLLKKKVIDDEYIQLILAYSDKMCILGYLKYIMRTIPAKDDDFFEKFDRLFPDFKPNYIVDIKA